MLRVLLVVSILLALRATTAAAQRPVRVSSWVTELGAGAGLDLGVRGPWMDRTWRSSTAHRVLMSVSMSLMYEFVIEPWNGQTNGALWSDAGQRLVGTLGTEALLAVLKRVF